MGYRNSGRQDRGHPIVPNSCKSCFPMTASHSKEHDRNAIPNVFGTERWGLWIIPCLSMTRRAEWWAGSVGTLLLTTDLLRSQ
jgi:hypothetical protein